MGAVQGEFIRSLSKLALKCLPDLRSNATPIRGSNCFHKMVMREPLITLCCTDTHHVSDAVGNIHERMTVLPTLSSFWRNHCHSFLSIV